MESSSIMISPYFLELCSGQTNRLADLTHYNALSHTIPGTQLGIKHRFHDCTVSADDKVMTEFQHNSSQPKMITLSISASKSKDNFSAHFYPESATI